jgi:hypothetical protein
VRGTLDFGVEVNAEAVRVAIASARQALDRALDDAREVAGEMLAAGRSEREVAGRLGVSRMTLRRWFGGAS